MNQAEHIDPFTGPSLPALVQSRAFSAVTQESHSDTRAEYDEPEESLLLSAIGIGPSGSRITSTLSRNLQKLMCHDLPGSFSADNLIVPPDILASLRLSHLRFLISGIDSASQCRMFQSIGTSLMKSEGISVGVIPNNQETQLLSSGYLDPLHRSVDCIIRVSAASLGAPSKFLENPGNFEAMTKYAMHHTVATITNLATERGIICIDFADVKNILESGDHGNLGSGVAADPDRGRTAALSAIARLKDQGAPLVTAKGILACVQGSTLLTMEDFDAASIAICEEASEDTEIIIGLRTEEFLGNNVRVTVLRVG